MYVESSGEWSLSCSRGGGVVVVVCVCVLEGRGYSNIFTYTWFKSFTEFQYFLEFQKKIYLFTSMQGVKL